MLGSHFQISSFINANFENANLTNVDFYYADLRKANFSGATLTGAEFERAYYDNSTIWPPDFTPEGAVSSKAEFPNEMPRLKKSDPSGAIQGKPNKSSSDILDSVTSRLRSITDRIKPNREYPPENYPPTPEEDFDF